MIEIVYISWEREKILEKLRKCEKVRRKIKYQSKLEGSGEFEIFGSRRGGKRLSYESGIGLSENYLNSMAFWEGFLWVIGGYFGDFVLVFYNGGVYFCDVKE